MGRRNTRGLSGLQSLLGASIEIGHLLLQRWQVSGLLHGCQMMSVRSLDVGVGMLLAYAPSPFKMALAPGPGCTGWGVPAWVAEALHPKEHFPLVLEIPVRSNCPSLTHNTHTTHVHTSPYHFFIHLHSLPLCHPAGCHVGNTWLE